MNHGKFVISLDFELMWGVLDTKTVGNYGQNILGVHAAIPRLLDLFKLYEIKATFATVGFLFCDNKEELLKALPKRKPRYKNPRISPYTGYFNRVEKMRPDKFHFAPALIKLLLEHPEHEMASHTFSHYYCLEEGQTLDDFKSDLEAAKSAASKKGIQLCSLVFPRNQFNQSYLEACAGSGVTCYRGNESSWMYKPVSYGSEGAARRLFRLLDSYLNITGHNGYSKNQMVNGKLVNIPASKFLRPYNPRLKFLDKQRFSRIKNSMTFAAKNKMTWHLWWHPHNFGIHTEENFAFLEKILKHYRDLHARYQFESITMGRLAGELMKEGSS